MDKTYTKWYNIGKWSWEKTAFLPVFITKYAIIVELHK